MKIKFGITSKLMLLFSLLIFIFYGTLLVLFVNIQNLLETSQQIISINNRVETVSRGLLDSLLSMDVNAKKFRLLKKNIYLTYFKSSKKEFSERLDQIISLVSPHPIDSE